MPNRKIMRDAGAVCFNMPVLKSDVSVGCTTDHIEREAYQNGYASGERAGFEMGEQKARVLLGKIEALIAELAALKGNIIRAAEPQCVELAVGIAGKILGHELTANPGLIVKLVKEALLKLERSGQITIKVNPGLYDFFMKNRPELAAIHPDIVFDADPSVSRTGAVVMGPVEDVVTDVDEQVRNLIKDMADRE